MPCCLSGYGAHNRVRARSFVRFATGLVLAPRSHAQTWAFSAGDVEFSFRIRTTPSQFVSGEVRLVRLLFSGRVSGSAVFALNPPARFRLEQEPPTVNPENGSIAPCSLIGSSDPFPLIHVKVES